MSVLIFFFLAISVIVAKGDVYIVLSLLAISALWGITNKLNDIKKQLYYMRIHLEDKESDENETM